ncbi:MAG: 4'-phosphopantetheinyl transferase superfamily protein [Wenzhouxiangellaceae bacterium]
MRETINMPLRSAPLLEQGEVHVWHARLKNLPVMEADSPVEHRDRVRQLRMGQKFVLRLLLGAYLEMPGRDVVTVRGAGGKPVLAPPLARSGITFNLSHADDCLAIAVGREMPVGIDIEQSDREVRWQQLARRWFSRDEADWLETLEPDAAGDEFLRLWTVREAMIKAMGATIAGHIARVTPEPGNPARIRLMPKDWPAADTWTLHELERDTGLRGWLAVPEPVASIRAFELGMP